MAPAARDHKPEGDNAGLPMPARLSGSIEDQDMVTDKNTLILLSRWRMPNWRLLSQ